MARHPNAPAYFHHDAEAAKRADRYSDPLRAARIIVICLAATPLMLLAAFGLGHLAYDVFRQIEMRVNAANQETSAPLSVRTASSVQRGMGR